MSKKKKLVICGLLFLLVLVNAWILQRPAPAGDGVELEFEIQSGQAGEIQVFYSPEKTQFSEENSQKKPYQEAGVWEQVTISLPENTKYIRLDFGNKKSSYEIRNLVFRAGKEKENAGNLLTEHMILENQTQIIQKDNILVETEGTDPYVVVEPKLESLKSAQQKSIETQNTIWKVLAVLVLDLGAVLAFLMRKKLGALPAELYQNRRLIFKLAKNDFKTKYAGSYLGIVWAFVQPVVTIMVYWFVFSVGFRTGSVDAYPFVLYLVTGIIPWFFFQDALNGGTNALIEYNYLVKKVVFKISILPIVKIVSAYFVHAFFVLFALVICGFMGYLPSIYWLQIFYYDACVFLFTLGLVYATSAIVIFFRDLTQIISIILQVGVWLTPIMWDFNMLANYPALQTLFKFNPFYYIVTGYRDSILGGVSILAHWKWGMFFWIVTAILFAVGAIVFKRLKPHFADVL